MWLKKLWWLLLELLGKDGPGTPENFEVTK